MNTIDYLCGQNWIDQYKDEASAIGECIESTCITSVWHVWKGPFGRLRNWDRTPQGRPVWHNRANQWAQDKTTNNYFLTI